MVSEKSPHGQPFCSHGTPPFWCPYHSTGQRRVKAYVTSRVSTFVRNQCPACSGIGVHHPPEHAASHRREHSVRARTALNVARRPLSSPLDTNGREDCSLSDPYVVLTRATHPVQKSLIEQILKAEGIPFNCVDNALSVIFGGRRSDTR